MSTAVLVGSGSTATQKALPAHKNFTLGNSLIPLLRCPAPHLSQLGKGRASSSLARWARGTAGLWDWAGPTPACSALGQGPVAAAALARCLCSCPALLGGNLSSKRPKILTSSPGKGRFYWSTALHKAFFKKATSKPNVLEFASTRGTAAFTVPLQCCAGG